MIAAYTCHKCDTGGTDPEESPGKVRCWNCGLYATVTARLMSTHWISVIPRAVVQ